MRYIECMKGHVFDADIYMECPYCKSGGSVISFGNNAAMQSVGKTVPASNQMPMMNMNASVGSTVAPMDYTNRQAQMSAGDTGKTVGVVSGNMKSEPVVGWLVCIEGPEKGRSYRILAKNNSIGRGENNDVVIKKDNTITRENHARISYDEKHNEFYLIPAESSNNIYLGDEPVFVPTKLCANKVIEFGASKFYFVPLCCEKFNWNDGLK